MAGSKATRSSLSTKAKPAPSISSTSKPTPKSKSSPPPSFPPIPTDASPLLTQESFERELRALASRAQEETWSNWASTHLRLLLQSGTLLFLAALSSNISQLALSPLFGGFPSAIHHIPLVMAACFIGWSGNLYIRRRLPLRKPQTLLPLIAAWIPVVQDLLAPWSQNMGAKWGPVVVQSLTLFPLLVLSVSRTATVLDDLEVNTSGRVQWLSDAMPGISAYAFFKGAEAYLRIKLAELMGTSLVFTRLGLQTLMAVLYAVMAPSRLLWLALPAVLHTAIWNPHVQLPYNTGRLNATLIAGGFTLLERSESLTGYLSVIESREQGFRLMRCDHSLLGGEWLARTDGGLREPVYGVFVMLEAVRLMERVVPVSDEEASALVIGLGIGTLPSALITHGIHTTIIEIDSAVHSLATKYFSLPPNHTSIIADAVTHAKELVQRGEQFDYVVHDVFTGGAEPLELFTVEFLSDLRALVRDGGVLALNYAGDLLLPAAHTTLRTILHIFPSCRLFRETAPPGHPESPLPPTPNGRLERDFTNLVIFCAVAENEKMRTSGVSENESGRVSGDRETKEKGNSEDSEADREKMKNRITFRDPVEADYLGSTARRMFLLPKWEVSLDDLENSSSNAGTGAKKTVEGSGDGDGEGEGKKAKEEMAEIQLLWRNNTVDFVDWQRESALGHWVVMRGVLPSWVWEAW